MKWTRLIKSYKESTLNTDENKKLVEKSMKQRGIGQLSSHGNIGGVSIYFYEQDNNQFLSIGNKGMKFDDKLAEILSQNLNKNVSFYDTDILETIYKIN